MVKSVIYGILFWLPLYCSGQPALAPYKTYISVTYDMASILASLLLGLVFPRIEIKTALLTPLIGVLLLAFVTIKLTDPSVLPFFALIAAVGVCLGGVFNTMAALVVVDLKRNARGAISSISLYAALSMAVANFATAATQLLIGFLASKDENNVFIIFVFYSKAAFIILAASIYL